MLNTLARSKNNKIDFTQKVIKVTPFPENFLFLNLPWWRHPPPPPHPITADDVLKNLENNKMFNDYQQSCEDFTYFRVVVMVTIPKGSHQ